MAFEYPAVHRKSHSAHLPRLASADVVEDLLDLDGGLFRSGLSPESLEPLPVPLLDYAEDRLHTAERTSRSWRQQGSDSCFLEDGLDPGRSIGGVPVVDDEEILDVLQLTLQEVYAGLGRGLEAEVVQEPAVAQQDAVHGQADSSVSGQGQVEGLAGIIAFREPNKETKR